MEPVEPPLPPVEPPVPPVEPPVVPPVEPPPVLQEAVTRATLPVTSAMLSSSGSTSTFSSSAEAAAVSVVVEVFDSSSTTFPTPGTSTVVGPAVLSETFLPRTTTSPRRLAEAFGFPPVSQVAVEVASLILSSGVRGRPGRCTLASTRLEYPSDTPFSAVARVVATFALTMVKVPPRCMPCTSAFSRLLAEVSGASTLLSETSSGTWIPLLSSSTSRSACSVDADALPAAPSEPAACAGDTGTKTRAPAVSTPKTFLYNVGNPH
ncbi:hypothetical protein C0036_09230 [Streptomyces sp. DJ]|nr:hypothetical protein C0036_09230 [Streptomyces sp. DJ]